MRVVFVLAMLALLSVASGTLVSDSIKSNYEKCANKYYPAMGLLDVRVDDVIPALGNNMMIIATIDNATIRGVYDAVQTGALAYTNEYYYHKDMLPDKALIYVDKAGGTQIGTGVVYAKWVSDSLKDRSDASNRIFVMKVMNATKVWTWEL